MSEFTMGTLGGTCVSGAGTTTGHFRAMLVVNDTVVSAIVADEITNITALATLTLPAGLIIYGNITSVTWTSGVFILYK